LIHAIFNLAAWINKFKKKANGKVAKQLTKPGSQGKNYSKPLKLINPKTYNQGVQKTQANK